MLSLKIGSTHINTANVEIPIVLKSPLFSTPDNKIPGSFAFNFPVPLTPELKKELQFAHRPARKGKPTWTHPFELTFGPLRFSGIANITQTTTYASNQHSHTETVEINFPIATGDLATILQGKTLKNLPTTQTIEYGTTLSFTSINKGYKHYQYFPSWPAGAYIPITPDLVRIDPQFIYNPDTNIWKIKETGLYYLHCIVNSHFKEEYLYHAMQPFGTGRALVIKKNGDVIITDPIDQGTPYQHWEYNNHIYQGTLNLQEDDELEFYVSAIGFEVYMSGEYILEITIDPGTSIAIDGVNNAFQNIIDKTYPQVNYAVFPFKNKMVLDSIPDSLYRVDMNDLKTFHQSFMSITNYYLDGRFPHIVSGNKHGQFHVLLNTFSISPYIAHIFDLLFKLIGYTPVNNVFASNELKKTVLTSNYIINNYFHDNKPVHLKEFLPDTPLADFLINICTLFGIAFHVNTQARTITFKFISDVIKDTTSIEFSDNVTNLIEIKTEDIKNFILEYKNIPCEFTSKNTKPLDHLIILDTLTTPEELPETANINDCYYINDYRYYAVWQYDEEAGIYQWTFYSIDFIPTVKGSSTDKDENILKIDLNLTTTADYFYDPEFIPGAGAPERPYLIPAYDDTLGNLVVGRFWLIPAFFANTNFRGLPQQYKQEDKAVVHFYHGMYEDEINQPYPFASAGTADTNHTPIPGATLSLRPADSNSIYHEKWKQFIQWRLNSPGEYKIYKYLTPLQIHNFNFLKWYKILGTDYLIKEIRFNITQHKISPAEITAHRR